MSPSRTRSTGSRAPKSPETRAKAASTRPPTALELWRERALAVPGEVLSSSVPLPVLLVEAGGAARFFEARWEATDEHPGLASAVNESFTAGTGQEVESLRDAVVEADLDYVLLAAEVQAPSPAPEARRVLRAILATLAWHLDNGDDVGGRAQLDALRAAHAGVGQKALALAAALEDSARLAESHQPRMFILNTAVHNPTGATLSVGVAHEVLRIAERFDFLLAEDDTFADFHPGVPVRLAALDRLQRVLLIGGFAKTLGGGLRVGYIAGHQALIRRLVDAKLLGCPTSPELGEQVVHRILADGQYRRHVDRLRQRLNQAQGRCLSALEALGCEIAHKPHAGMFIWADCGRDSEVLARAAVAQGLLLAPGVLFSPQAAPSRMLRVPVTLVEDATAWAHLAQLFASVPPTR